MKRSGGIVVLVFVILGFFLSPSSLTADDISKDIAAFRTQFQLALDTIHKAQPGQTLDMKTLSDSIKKMEKVLDSIKKRVKAEQGKKIVVKSSKADEAALRAMMDQVRREKEQSEEKREEEEREKKREHLAKLEGLIKELWKIHEQIKDPTRQFY
jgi:hypothetical protein